MRSGITIRLVLVGAVAAVGTGGSAAGEPPAGPGGGKVEAAGPRWPGSVLGVHLGEYVTIAGVRAEDGKVGKRTLIVDTVNGKKLTRPVPIWVSNLELPAKQRCVLKGYETGSMIGTPPAVLEAARERGRTAGVGQAGWQWKPHFVALIAVEPKGLNIPEE